ncbi:hypothetical protein [Allokutzneria oryzae]|uniref:Uncharacterized protein n=1 Tax=Allokutzneria oryzae TaxID=1378989 RepID=A0ABV6A395_9PSEU
MDMWNQEQVKAEVAYRRESALRAGRRVRVAKGVKRWWVRGKAT